MATPIRPVRRLVRPIPAAVGAVPALDLPDGIEAVVDLMARHPGAVVITGAGISTESGIPDYRGPSGIHRGATPMSYDEFIGSAAARTRYWARAFAGWPVMGRARPNAGHIALAALQRGGHVRGVITQNVDRLHARVGTDPLTELHGTLDRVVCLACGVTGDREDVQRRLAQANPGFPVGPEIGDDAGEVRPDGDRELIDTAVARFQVVDCAHCGGPLKPDVVFFGENVPRGRSDICAVWVERAPMLIVLGSSLAVMSAYRFVRQAQALGRPVLIVNQGPTRGDPQAGVRVDAPLGALLSAVAHRLAGGGEPHRPPSSSPAGNAADVRPNRRSRHDNVRGAP